MSRRWAIASLSLVALTALVLAAFLPLSPGALPEASTPGMTAASPVTPDPLIQAAMTSLERGDGPAQGQPSVCSVTGAGEASCGPTPSTGVDYGSSAVGASSSVPASAAATPQWFGVEPNISAASGGVVPSVQFSGRMAYDPQLSEIVLFDGCSMSACPGNYTWTYDGQSWDNVSRHVAPSARTGEGFDYDPSFGGVVLFGGMNAKNATLDDTWLFTGSGWSNVTLSVGVPLTVGGGAVGWSWGGMAFDPALNTTVVVDGCRAGTLYTCASFWDYTWYLNFTSSGDGWGVSWGPGALTSSTSLAYSSAAYDESDHDLVVFGGYDLGEETGSNDTFLLTSSGTWENVTGSDAGCANSVCYTPPGRVSAAMTWDGQLGAIFLAGGYNVATGDYLNDSWIFSGGSWFPANLTGLPAPSNYCGGSSPAMAESSVEVAPFLVGGSSTTCNPQNSISEWVYEPPPEPTLNESSTAFNSGTPVNFTIAWTVGTGSGVVAGWNLSLGDGQYNDTREGVGKSTSVPYAENLTLTYSTGGNFTPTVTWSDFFYVNGTARGASVQVNGPFSVKILPSATTIQAGGSVTFSVAATGGNPPYTYAWTFGDGATSSSSGPVTHSYSSTGIFTVHLAAQDAAGNSTTASVLITVNAAGFLGGLGPVTYLIIAIVAVAVVALLGVLILSRRPKPPSAARPWQPPSPPPPPGAMKSPPKAATRTSTAPRPRPRSPRPPPPPPPAQ